MNTHESAARVADMQAKGVRNAFAFGRAATGMFERLARQNYAVMGDVVDYTLAQIRIPTQHTDPRAALEAQAAGTRGLVEKARARADEYVSIAGEMRELVGNAARVAPRTASAAAPAPAPAATPVPAASAPTAKAVQKPSAKATPASTTGSAPKAAPKSAGGTPIILPGDSPKAAGRKAAEAAPAKPAARRRAAAPKAPAPRTAAKKAATKPTARRGAKG